MLVTLILLQVVSLQNSWLHFDNNVLFCCIGNARCTNTADTVIGQIHACHESVTSNVDQLTSDLTYLSQKGNFCRFEKLQ